MKRRLLAPFVVVAAAAVLAPVSFAKTIQLRDGSQFVVAGSHVNCVVMWSQGLANVVCFVLNNPLGKPPKGTYGFDISSRGVIVTQYSGASLQPAILHKLVEPSGVPADEAAQKGSVRQNLVLHVGDYATIAGSSLVLGPQPGKDIGIAVAPMSKDGKAVAGGYGVGMTDHVVVILRYTGAGGTRVVYQRT